MSIDNEVLKLKYKEKATSGVSPKIRMLRSVPLMNGMAIFTVKEVVIERG